MKPIAHFSLRDLEPIELESILLPSAETNVKIKELKLGDENHLIQIRTSSLNTLFDFSKSSDYQVLYFDHHKSFIAASYAINNEQGNFLVETQAKWVMLIPIESSLDNAVINKIERLELRWKEENKAELLKTLVQDFPTTVHTGIGTLFTNVRRKKAEKELDVPLAWRNGAAISVETGKRGNEMNESEWNKFYTDLCENLKRDYPWMYDSLFS